MDVIKVDRLYAISLMVKELEAEATLIKDELKVEFDAGVHIFGNRKVSITEATRETLDKAGLKELLGEKLTEYIKTTSYKSVSVK